MHSSTLIQVFSQLSRRDLRELRKFVRSPYFNQRADVIRLFDYLAAEWPCSAAAVHRSKLFEAVFPKQSFDIVSLRHLMSFLLNIIKKYFIQQQLEEQSQSSSYHLCHALRKRGIDQLFQKEMNHWEKQIQAAPHRNTKHFYFNYLHHQEYYEFASLQTRKGDLHLQQQMNDLTTFYLSDTLRQSCLMLTHTNMYQQDYKSPLLDSVLALIEQQEDALVPAISVYYHAYRALSNPAHEAHFRDLKKLLQQHWQLFPINEARDIYMLALNFCIKQLNTGQKQYIKEAFDLYKNGLDNKVFFEQGFLSTFNYKNILRLAVATKAYDWAQTFLNTFKSYLPPNDQENSFNYNLAYFHFQQGQYNEAIPLLQQIEFKDTFNNLDARRMLLRIYYELSEYNALDSLLDSFYAYALRQKDLGYQRENYLNLIKFMRKLIRLKPDAIVQRKKLRTAVLAAKRVAEKEWLLGQIDQN